MRTLLLKNLIINDRQRKTFSPKELAELKKGILTKGLMHPPVVEELSNSQFRLIAGERRVRAITELHQEGHSINFENEIIPILEIPYTLLNSLSEADRFEAELEENLLRSNLTWLEESEARNALHELRAKANPTQTVLETAREISEKTGSNLNTERHAVARAIIIAKNKDNPKVKNARTEREAVTAILDESENLFKARNSALLRKQSSSDHKVIHGDLFDELLLIPKQSVETVICDPPYGINADKMGKGEFHLYDDSPEAALETCKHIIEQAFRITKNRALMFLFCDFEHFVTLRDHAARMAWTPWRTPITWIKGTDGHAPWGRAGFIRTTEVILFCTKGQKELQGPGGPDHLIFKRPSKADRLHSAEKPVELLSYLISISTLAGETVLDPCCGSGSIIEAAKLHRVKTIAIEKELDYYHQALTRTEI